MARTYTRVTPEIEATVLAVREQLGPTGYADIAEVAGVPERTVKYILVDLPRLRRVHNGDAKAEGSLKQRIYRCVQDVGMFKDVGDLRRVLGMADDEHNVLNALHALHSQGKIDFTERGNGMGTATVVNIRLPKKGKRTDIVNAGIPFDQSPLPVVSREEEERAISAKHNGSEATTQEAPQPTAPSAPEPESEGYPLLDALLDRERNRLDSDSKAFAYVNAAEAIQTTDPEMYDMLMAKAAQHDVTFPSPLEQEYIRYVAAHPAPAGPDVQAQAKGD